MEQSKLMKDKDTIILRCYNGEMRAREEEDKGIIEGYAIVYDSMTDLGYFNEIIEAGALEKTNLKDVRLLVNHNTDMIPLARSRNNNENSTMHLIVDKKGLFVRIKLDIENNSDARNLYSAIKRGDITGMSFMFTIDREEWEELDSEHPTRRIKSIGQVFEVSAVTFPAYESTEINARDKAALDSAKLTLESMRSQSLESDKAAALELEKAKLLTQFI